MQRNVTITNMRSERVNYEIKDDHLSTIDANPTVAVGGLNPGQSEVKTITTYSDTSEFQVYYRLQLSGEAWRGWDHSWVHGGLVELR